MDEYEVEKIVGKRQGKKGAEYLVKWKGFDPKDNTWEPKANLASCIDMI